jgi:hypothetical protein
MNLAWYDGSARFNLAAEFGINRIRSFLNQEQVFD